MWRRTSAEVDDVIRRVRLTASWKVDDAADGDVLAAAVRACREVLSAAIAEAADMTEEAEAMVAAQWTAAAVLAAVVRDA